MWIGNNQNDYFSFDFGREDGTRMSKEEFIKEHQDVKMTPVQLHRMFENLELQGMIFLREYGGKKVEEITGHCKKFVFIDNQTKETYFKPLYEIDVNVFFKNLIPVLLIYDIRMAT